MAEPPQYPPPAMKPQKRVREVDDDSTSKRVRSSSYSTEMIENGLSSSANAARHAQAHSSPGKAYAVRAQQLCWLQNADKHLQATSLPNSFKAPGIPLESNLTEDGTPRLRPGMVFGLRSLTPAQRFYHYYILCNYGRDMLQQLNSGQGATRQWKLICDMTNSMARKENKWYMSFFQDKTGQERLNQIKEKQTISVKLNNTDIQAVVSAPSSTHQIHSTGGSQSEVRVILDSGTPLAGSNNPSGARAPSVRPGTIKIQPSSNGLKRTLEAVEETEEQKAARKKICTERTDAALHRFESNETDIIDHWEEIQGARNARWYEKLDRWEKDRIARLAQKAKLSVKAKSTRRSDSGPSNTEIKPFKKPSKNRNWNSPAEIQSWRNQYKDARPDERKHSMDKVALPDYPREDKVENSVLRADRLYECQHLHKSTHGKFQCCKKGLNAAAKDKSCKKAIRVFQVKVEELVISGDLHICHKDWDSWYNKKITNQKEKDRIDALLQAVDQPQQVGNVHPRESPQIKAVRFTDTKSPYPAAQILVDRQTEAIKRTSSEHAQDLPILLEDQFESSRLQLASKTTSQDSKGTKTQKKTTTAAPIKKQAVTTTAANKAATLDLKARDSKEAVPATQNLTSIAEQELRKVVRESVIRQQKQSEAVFIGGIDISKESYKENPYGVIEKIVRSMKDPSKGDNNSVLEVHEAASGMGSPADHSIAVKDEVSTATQVLTDEELALQFIDDDSPWAGDAQVGVTHDRVVRESPLELSDADLDSLFDDGAVPMNTEQGDVAEETAVSEIAMAASKLLAAQSNVVSSSDSSKKIVNAVESCFTKDKLVVSRMSATEELYNSLLIDGEPCHEFVDTFSEEYFTHLRSSAPDGKQTSDGDS